MKAAGVELAPVLAAIHWGAYEAPWSEADIGRLLASPGVFALMAENDGAPVAFVLARVVADEAEVLTLATLPHSRRRGFGLALMEGAAEMAKAHGARRLLLEVAEDNFAALALYERLGFQTVGKRHAYYARADGARDARVLSLDLFAPRP